VSALLQPWVDALGEGPDVRRAGEELLSRYAEPHRRYHDLRHLAEVLAALRTLGAGTAVPVVLAAYWHDAVYDPRAPDNEARSAVLAGTVLGGLGLEAAAADEVVRLVLLTATHDPDPHDTAGGVLCDADLAVLGAPPARYRTYAADVRREYGHLDDEAFRAGRAAVLRDLLGRTRLFTTEPGRRRWDATARRNLQDELARLGAAPPPAGA
jgi:predicted metal-dependent HD superfamily phosphohydrolase